MFHRPAANGIAAASPVSTRMLVIVNVWPRPNVLPSAPRSREPAARSGSAPRTTTTSAMRTIDSAIATVVVTSLRASGVDGSVVMAFRHVVAGFGFGFGFGWGGRRRAAGRIRPGLQVGPGHRPGDRAGVGVVNRGLKSDAAAVENDESVAHRDELVDVAGDEQYCGAAVARLEQLAMHESRGAASRP